MGKSKKLSKIREYLGIIGVLLSILAVTLAVILLFVVLFVSLNCGDEGLIDRLVCYLFGVSGEGSKGSIIRGLGFGLIALLGILVANRRAVAMEKTVQEQAKEVRETEKGRRQGRFRDAVSHLGNTSESVRQGGAYGLFHLALEEESLRRSIAEILCAHIRGVTRESEYREKYKTAPSTEIQSLMTLLFSKRDLESEKSLKKFWQGITPDLSGGFFRGIELKEAQFREVILDDAQFQGASLLIAQFQGASLREAQFQGADLPIAQFQGADLLAAKFQGAYLLATKFQGTNLHKSQFQGASLREAQFQGANLLKSQFQGADLLEAQFQGVYSSQLLMASFQKRIRNQIGRESDLSEVVFSGGLTQEKVDNLVSQLKGFVSDDRVISLKDALQEHVGKPPSNIPPDGAVTGKYDENDAERWITEYENAMKKVKTAD